MSQAGPLDPFSTTNMSIPASGPLRKRVAWMGIVGNLFLFSWLIKAQNHWNLWALSVVVGAVVLFLCGYVYRFSFGHLMPMNWQVLAVGLGAGSILAGATHLTFPWIERWFPAWIPQLGELYQDLQAPPGVLAALPILAFLVFCEELLWRGLLYDLVSGKGPPWLVVVLCGLIFPIPHLLTGYWVLALAAFCLGLFCATLRHISGTVTVPFLTHLVWNLWVMVVFPVVPS